MERLDRLKKIKYQYRKPKQAEIDASWESVDYVTSAQSTLNAQVLDDIVTLEDSEMPIEFLGADLDWAAGADDDTIVKIRNDSIYVVQDLTENNLQEHEFTSSPNIGLGYLGKSYYGGAL